MTTRKAQEPSRAWIADLAFFDEPREVTVLRKTRARATIIDTDGKERVIGLKCVAFPRGVVLRPTREEALAEAYEVLKSRQATAASQLAGAQATKMRFERQFPEVRRIGHGVKG